MNPIAIATTAFLASGVEMVEALTIVLAVMYTNGWRPAFQGTLAAFVALAALVALGVPLLHALPEAWVKIGVGAFALWFGWGWLHKAVLRAAGRKALHDEAAIYAQHTAALSTRERGAAFATAFNGVFLEGLEVALIVLAVGGASLAALGWAIGGATIALVLVVAAGIVLHAPLSRVPENVMKFFVGVMLTTFGIFWLGEGLGVAWPGNDVALLAIALGTLLVALLAVGIMRREQPA